MIVIFAKILRKIGYSEAAASLLIWSLKRRPDSISIFREYCLNRMTVRDFTGVIDRCEAVTIMPNAEDALKDAASFFLTRASLKNKPNLSVLKSLQNSFQKASSHSKELQEAGEDKEASKVFGKGLNLAGIPNAAIFEWETAFGLLGKNMALGDTPLKSAGEDSKPISKLAVSGMYWSGSGAVYAYLNEFDQVSAVPGELRLWKEGNFSLNSLSQKIKKQVEFRKGLQHFLFTALTGTGAVSNWQEQMAVDYALKAAREDLNGSYAKVCRIFIEEALSVSNKDEFTKTAANFSDSLARIWGAGDNRIVLFDNIIHIGGIEATALFGDAKIICVFRDPRSNFTARWYENPRFHRDVERFITYYRDTVQSFDKEVSRNPAEYRNVLRVSFEQFVHSEEYRNTIADFCGLDLKRRKDGKFFRPLKSKKNTTNYKSFPDQAVIRKIEKELGAYCIDELTGD